MFVFVLPRALHWSSPEWTHSWSGGLLPPISCGADSVVRCSRVFCSLWVVFIVWLLSSRQLDVSVSRSVGGRGKKRCACRKNGLRTFLVGFHIDPFENILFFFFLLLKKDDRRGCCSSKQRGSSVPCMVAVLLHFYAAIQPLIKRRHMRLKSTFTPQIKCLWVHAAADRIWTSTGDQHAQIGRFYNPY